MKRQLFAIVASVFAATGLQAGTPVMPDTMLAPVESEWSFRFAPYAWLVAIDGDVGVGPFTAPVDISISDTLDKLDMAYNADIGGFDVSSDLVWQAFLGIGCRMTGNSTVAIGYRGMGVDYTSEAFSPMDTITHGPLLGFEFRF